MALRVVDAHKKDLTTIHWIVVSLTGEYSDDMVLKRGLPRQLCGVGEESGT